MKYKGQELEEITEPQIFDPPKKMLVWNNGEDEPMTREVWGIAPQSAHDPLPIGSAEGYWQHCAEIPEEPKPRRATNRELAKWLAQGNGEVIDSTHNTTTYHEYFSGLDNNDVHKTIQVRKWDDTEWHEPDVKYMGVE